MTNDLREKIIEALELAKSTMGCYVEEAADAIMELLPKWMPIESAPKDGTSILLREADDYIFIGYWFISLNETFKSHWASWSDDYTNHAPTHWMPLPQPPVASND